MFKKRQMPMFPMQGQPMMDQGMGGQPMQMPMQQMPQMPMQQIPQQMPQMPQMPMQQMPMQGGVGGTNYDLVRLQTEIKENRRLINDLYRRVVRLENYLGIRSEAETENKNIY